MIELIAAIAIAGTFGALTDWLFMGVLFHGAYDRYPEIWRPGVREGKDRSAIILSAVLGYLITFAVFVLCMFADTRAIWQGMLVATVAWLAGPFVVIIINGVFIKMDGRIVFSHCVGYLARMLLAGMAAGFVLGQIPAHSIKV